MEYNAKGLPSGDPFAYLTFEHIYIMHDRIHDRTPVLSTDGGMENC